MTNISAPHAGNLPPLCLAFDRAFLHRQRGHGPNPCHFRALLPPVAAQSQCPLEIRRPPQRNCLSPAARLPALPKLLQFDGCLRRRAAWTSLELREEWLLLDRTALALGKLHRSCSVPRLAPRADRPARLQRAWPPEPLPRKLLHPDSLSDSK